MYRFINFAFLGGSHRFVCFMNTELLINVNVQNYLAMATMQEF